MLISVLSQLPSQQGIKNKQKHIFINCYTYKYSIITNIK